jgi:hypothetical protein
VPPQWLPDLGVSDGELSAGAQITTAVRASVPNPLRKVNSVHYILSVVLVTIGEGYKSLISGLITH